MGRRRVVRSRSVITLPMSVRRQVSSPRCPPAPPMHPGSRHHAAGRAIARMARHPQTWHRARTNCGRLRAVREPPPSIERWDDVSRGYGFPNAQWRPSSLRPVSKPPEILHSRSFSPCARALSAKKPRHPIHTPLPRAQHSSHPARSPTSPSAPRTLQLSLPAQSAPALPAYPYPSTAHFGWQREEGTLMTTVAQVSGGRRNGRCV